MKNLTDGDIHRWLIPYWVGFFGLFDYLFFDYLWTWLFDYLVCLFGYLIIGLFDYLVIWFAYLVIWLLVCLMIWLFVHISSYLLANISLFVILIIS